MNSTKIVDRYPWRGSVLGERGQQDVDMSFNSIQGTVLWFALVPLPGVWTGEGNGNPTTLV